jgi:hypothetical protein
MDPDIHVVNNQHHYLPTCPCPDCRKKRTRQVGPSFSIPTKRLIAVPPKVAVLLGYVPGIRHIGKSRKS